MLWGRRSECAELDLLLTDVRAGESRAIVVRGEPGIGKTALLGYAREQARGCRVARAAGVPAEAELAFAGLHQLCAPMLDRLHRLPAPQRTALRTAFGLQSGGAPDRFLVGLAVLSLLAEVAERQPLVCLVDNVQWLDTASAQVLAFVARRLRTESVAMVFAVREPAGDHELAGLPQLTVAGLADADARALLQSALSGPLDALVGDRIVAESGGNPLALLEFPRALTPAELAGGFGLPDPVAPPGRIEEGFRRRLQLLRADTRRLLLVLAAEPFDGGAWRAAEQLALGTAAAAAATAAGLPAQPGQRRAIDALLDGLAVRLTTGYGAAAPMLSRALRMFRDLDADSEPGTRSLWIAGATPALVALEVWDDDGARQLSVRHLRRARATGALVQQQLALALVAHSHLLAGELATAQALVDEERAVGRATGNPGPDDARLLLAGWRGGEAEASVLIEAALRDAAARGEGRVVDHCEYAGSVLYNGLGRHRDALRFARRLFERDSLGYGALVLPELVEAAHRTGERELATRATEWMSERATVTPTDWARGMQARAQALLCGDAGAEELFLAAIERLGRTRLRVELARGRLLYGEWLRRQRRRRDAREQLRTAHEMFTAMGVRAFAERAERELLATGEHARKRTVETIGQLTPQEAQIARLARDGLANPEIGARLFISPRTVQYHLHKVFAKLDISSRTELARAPVTWAAVTGTGTAGPGR